MQYIDDKAALGEAMGDLLPPPATEEAVDLLIKWTKYEKCPHPDYTDRDIWPVKFGDDMSAVAVKRPDTGNVGIVFRQLVDQQTVTDPETGEPKKFPDGRPMVINSYELVGIRPCSSATAALDILNQIRTANDLAVARDIDGWGEPEDVEPAAKPADDIEF